MSIVSMYLFQPECCKSKTSTKQWDYVESDNNPADYASRVLDFNNNNNKIKRWFDGQLFLWNRYQC